MAFVLPAVVGIIALAILHSHQTVKVADASYPIMAPPTVSIIVPAFNEEELIERALTSILNQNVVQAYPEMFEIIVVDNESTDNTVSIASKYARVISAPRGKLNALNAGVAAANGDIIYFSDADVIAPPNLLNTILQHFIDPSIVAVSGSPHHFEGVGHVLDVVWTTANSTACVKVNGACMAIRKTAFYTVGGFNESVDQFDRKKMQEEEEFGFLAKLQQLGTVLLDSEATFYAPPRIQMCISCTCEVECKYCTDIRTKQRF